MQTKFRSALLVFGGGAAGSVLRFAVAQLLPMLMGLWIVNILGAGLIGFVQGRAAHSTSRFAKADLQLFWGAGFSGGFTTMSSFALGIVLLELRSNLWWAVGYGTSQIIVGLVVHRVVAGLAARGGNLD